MDIIIRVAVFAFLIEAIVEVLRPIWHKLDFTEDLQGFSLAYVISIVLGIAGALAFNIDALPAFGIVGSGLAGEIITGLLASGGSSYIYELLHGAKDIGKDKEDGKKEEKPEEKPEERKKA